MRSKLLVIFSFLLMLIACRADIEQQRNMIQPIPFEKAKWNARDYEDRVEFRPGMARKFVKDKSLIGKSRAEIIEMLGDEGSTKSSLNNLSYQLDSIEGIADPMAIEYLQIKFDSENKVENAEIEFHKTRHWRN